MMEIDEMVDRGEMSRQCLRAGRKRREVFGSVELLDAFIGSRDLEIVPDGDC